MEKKTLLIIGLIGGIIATVGVFLEWGGGVSGWDFRVLVSYPYVVLLGGILALIGGILALATSIKPTSYLLPVGGIVALLGWIWAATDVVNWSAMTYGFYTCLVGAILALVGSLSLRGK